MILRKSEKCFAYILFFILTSCGTPEEKSPDSEKTAEKPTPSPSPSPSPDLGPPIYFDPSKVITERFGRGEKIQPISADDPNKLIKIKLTTTVMPQFDLGSREASKAPCPARVHDVDSSEECMQRKGLSLQMNVNRAIIANVLDLFDVTRSFEETCISKYDCDNSPYKAIGHSLEFAKSEDKKAEKIALAVIGRNKSYTEKDSDNPAFLEAKDWDLVVNYTGILAEKLQERCKDPGFQGSWKGELACEWGSDEGSSYDFGSGNYVTAADDQTKNTPGFFWQPVPEPGYKCLGIIVSNSDSKPTVMLDYALNQASQRDSALLAKIWGAAAIDINPGILRCIRDNHLVEGILKDSYTENQDDVDPVLWTKKVVRWPGHDTKVTVYHVGFFQVTHKLLGDKGYSSKKLGWGDTGTFIALQGETQAAIKARVKKINEGNPDKKDKVWVFKRSDAVVYKESCLLKNSKGEVYCREKSEWGTVASGTNNCAIEKFEVQQKQPCKLENHLASCSITRGLSSEVTVYYDKTYAKNFGSKACLKGTWRGVK